MSKKEKKLYRLDLGCGDNKKEGFTGVDKFKTASVDIVCDLCVFPWKKIESNSVEEVWSSHFFEHIPAKIRPKFMDELCRVMIVGAKATFITPYNKSPRATQDFSHEWPPVSEESYLYFNKGWREQNKLTHGYYEMSCDFDFTFGYAVQPEWQSRAEDARNYAIKHYWNAVSDLWCTLIKR